MSCRTWWSPWCWPTGKSTLLRTIAGLLPAREGTISINGAPVTGVPDNLAVVFQDYGRSLFP
jgi:NitT/TauT family transport system ATP-binding protein